MRWLVGGSVLTQFVWSLALRLHSWTPDDFVRNQWVVLGHNVPSIIVGALSLRLVAVRLLFRVPRQAWLATAISAGVSLLFVLVSWAIAREDPPIVWFSPPLWVVIAKRILIPFSAIGEETLHRGAVLIAMHERLGAPLAVGLERARCSLRFTRRARSGS